MNRLAKYLLILALAVSIGAHWVVLQGVAWTTMLARFSQTMPFTEAVASTFDGKHPCKLCLAVQKGQQEEKKDADLKPLQKLVLILDGQRFVLVAPSSPCLVFDAVNLLHSRFEKPLLPPPRVAFGSSTGLAWVAGVRCELTAKFAAAVKPCMQILATAAGTPYARTVMTGWRANIGTSPMRCSEVPRLWKTLLAGKVAPMNFEATCTNRIASLRYSRPSSVPKMNPGQVGGPV